MPPSGPKINPTIRHILDRPCPFKTVPRLDAYVTPTTQSIDYDDLASFLGGSCDANTLFFPDMCFLNGPEVPDPVWDEILRRRLVITPFIGREMSEWLADPYRNKRVAAAIRDAADGEKHLVVLDEKVGYSDEHHFGRMYYATLLGYRKSQVRDLINRFERETGRKPTADELDRLLNKNSIPKDRQLLKKGAQDLSRACHFFSDEDLVVTAGFGGLWDGAHAVILTRDRDVLEQFDKFTELITVQYFAMLFAERFVTSPTDFVIHRLPIGIPTIDAYVHADESFMVRKPVGDPDEFVGWLLPREYAPVKLSCILLGGNGPDLKVTLISFNAERDMYRLITTKGRTRGLSTDLLGGRNCHVTGYMVGIPEPRAHVLITHDRTRPSDGGELRFSELDIAQAIRNNMVNSDPVLDPPSPESG